MEADRGSGPGSAAAERQPRIDDETPSEAAAPTTTILERETGFATPEYYSQSPSESRPRDRPVRYNRERERQPPPSLPPHRGAVNTSVVNYDSSSGYDSTSYKIPRRERIRRSRPRPAPSSTRESDNHSYRRFREYNPRSRSREHDLRIRSPSPSEWSTYDIDLDSNEPRSPDEPLPQEWTQPRTILEDNTATELIMAQSIEHRVSKSGLERIVLLSPSRPPPSSGLTSQEREKSRVQFRWLHVQPNTPKADDVESAFQTLERFVLSCPFISDRIRAATLLFLRNRARKVVKTAEAHVSTLQRLESKTRQDQFVSLEIAPVLFLGTLGVEHSYAGTLLKATRGYEVGNERELSQVACKMGVGGGRDVLHAAALWCLSLSPGIMITLCCLPSTDLRRDLIKIDDRAGRGFYTVQVKLQDVELCHSIVIDPDCSYVDFLQHAVAVATSGTRVRDAAKYDILYEFQTSVDAGELEQLEVLTPSKWLKLLGSDGFENNTFHLKAKFRARSRSRRPYYHERRSPPFIRRSRRSPHPIRRSSYLESPRPRAPLPTSTRYGYSKDTSRAQTHNDKALVVHKKDQRAIRRVDSEKRPELVFLRDFHEHRSGLDTNQNWWTMGDNVVRRRSKTRRESPPVLIGSERERYVGVRRHSTDFERDHHVEVRGRSPSECNSPVIERQREIIRRVRSRDMRWRRGRSQSRRRWEREYDSNSNDTPAAEQETPPLDDSGAVTVNPFFAWRVKSMADVDTVRGDKNNNSTSPMTDVTIHNLFRILGKINESLLSSESGVKEAYSQAYRCTEENLLKRHPNLTREIVPNLNTSPTVQRDGVGQRKEADQEKAVVSADNSSTQPPATFPLDWAQASSANQEQETAQQEKTEPSKIGDEQAPAKSQTGTQEATYHSTSVMMIHPADAFGKQLVEISQAIMHRFLPKDEHSIYHVVCERFWGSVDEAIRQVRWSTEPSGASWTIRDFDIVTGTAGGSGGVTAKKSYAGCTACSTTTKYPSASAALQHLHTAHFECPLGEPAAGKAKDRPNDDPCYVYIKSLTETHSNEPEIENIAKELIDHLSDFSGSLNKIQWLVATNSQDNAQRRRSQTKPAIRPQLPRSLVYAFDELVSYYILQAKRLSFQNQGITLNARSHAPDQGSAQAALNRAEKLALWCRDTRARLQSYLQQARRDVIVSRGGHGGGIGVGDDDGVDAAALGVQAFDTTSFMRALIRSVLDTSFSAPLPLKKAAGIGSTRVGLGRQEVGKNVPARDVIWMYSEYSKHLHAEAARRPRRRLFLDIHALEDELDALEALLYINLDWINRTLSNFPEQDHGTLGDFSDQDEFFVVRRRLEDEHRAWAWQYREVRTMEVERYYLLGRQDAVQAKLDEVQNLQKSARALRERVRQLIEVMDEDHGKAIRVFTIVTVLFLPMTFVSGFFGMNTADIRDIEANQSLYWTIAVPVTVVVLGFALAYGYKGDEITDWIRDRNTRWKSSRFPRSAEVMGQGKLETSKTIDGRRVTWAGTDAGEKDVWRTVRNSVRRRKWRTDTDMTRRSTFQTDILP